MEHSVMTRETKLYFCLVISEQFESNMSPAVKDWFMEVFLNGCSNRRSMKNLWGQDSPTLTENGNLTH
jgi:hypothetical protein